MLGPVAAVPTPGLPPGIVTLLQDKLLPLVLRVFEAHPAGGERRKALRDAQHSPRAQPRTGFSPMQGMEMSWQGMGLSQRLGSFLAANVPFESGTPQPRAAPLPPTRTLALQMGKLRHRTRSAGREVAR